MALPPPSESTAALVTGASSGIGAALARELAGRGYATILSARREDQLRALAGEISADHGTRSEVVVADLATDAGLKKLTDAVDGLGLNVEILINNAGFGGFGQAHETSPERQSRMVRLNCETLVHLQALYTAKMAERGRGAVLNLASTASFQPLPGSATYAASKAFVLSLSEATHAELSTAGVTVTALCPGPVHTEFGEVAGAGSAEERLPEPFWLDADEVASQAIAGMGKGKRVIVPGLLNRAGALGGHHMPRALMLPIMGRAARRIF